ncbi:MAG: CYTH domain-containing protein [Prevotella sp.]|nr:CYTH domain-containing protein [Staphylococcus sp.]MCM1349585.1 CYTH domain-containing protein [Prevotella sp.]
MEIERKFFIEENQNMPNLMHFQHCRIEQYYLTIQPEIRLRRISTHQDHCVITVKGEGTLEREETEFEISKDVFENLQKAKMGNMIQKTRYQIPLDNDLIAELDIYEGDLTGLKTVEVEFLSLDAAADFSNHLPKWFGKEITENKQYKNKYLACTSALENIQSKPYA